MTPTRHFGSYTEARTRLRDVLDAAHSGVVTTVVRDHEQFVVTSGAQRREELVALWASEAVAAPEGGGWSVVLPGVPVHGDADTFDAAVDDLVDALREYAQDWNDRLRVAPNHRHLRPVVELVELSTDFELRAWILGGEPGAQVTSEHSTFSASSS